MSLDIDRGVCLYFGMDPDFEWPLPVKHRTGAPYNLGSIDVFHDFEWRDHFPDERTHFQNGKCLAEQAFDACPEGKTAVLLLTELDDREGSFETDSSFVLAINLPQYLKLANANAAVSYLARSLGPGITNASHLSRISERTPEELRRLLEQELTAERIGEWAAGNAERVAALRKIAAPTHAEESAQPAEALAVLKELDELDVDALRVLAKLLETSLNRDDRLELLNALTSNSDGRRDAGEILGRRASDRLADARTAVREYSSLLDNPSSNETTFQNFIEKNLWLLGLDYVQMRSRHDVPRGILDFILERFDGFHDLLELKDPQDPIIEAPDEDGGRPPSASLYKLSPALSNALAQVHVYRDILTANPQLLDQQYGLPQSRDPYIVIVIGRAGQLSDDRARVLRELNRSLHRVEVVPYDVLGMRAEAILESIQEHWTAAGGAD